MVFAYWYCVLVWCLDWRLMFVLSCWLCCVFVLGVVGVGDLFGCCFERFCCVLMGLWFDLGVFVLFRV